MADQKVGDPPPAYPGGQYPPPGQQYPPPGQQYPPPGQQYPPPGQQYPPPGQQYPPPGQQYPPPGQQYPAGHAPPPGTVVVTQPAATVIVQGNVCGNCRVGVIREDFTVCGIILAICFFPLGVLCCWLMRERRCTNCGASY